MVKTMDDVASASREQAFRGTGDREMEQMTGVIQENSADFFSQALLLKGLLERFRFDNTDVR